MFFHVFSCFIVFLYHTFHQPFPMCHGKYSIEHHKGIFQSCSILLPTPPHSSSPSSGWWFQPVPSIHLPTPRSHDFRPDQLTSPAVRQRRFQGLLHLLKGAIERHDALARAQGLRKAAQGVGTWGVNIWQYLTIHIATYQLLRLPHDKKWSCWYTPQSYSHKYMTIKYILFHMWSSSTNWYVPSHPTKNDHFKRKALVLGVPNALPPPPAKI